MAEHNSNAPSNAPSIEINNKLGEATQRRNSRIASWDDISARITDTTPEGLAPLDQLHSGGLAFTRFLAKLANIQKDEDVLEVGCGVGGPARMLAAEQGACVTGIDITAGLIDVATRLSEVSGIPVKFEQGDALDLPFEDESFDLVWTQHAAASIADKDKLYSEMRRVLRPGGRLAMHDLVRGPTAGPLHMPIPSADSEDVTFILQSGELRNLLSEMGFREVLWRDVTEATIGWFDIQPPPDSFSIRMIKGETYTEMVENLISNFRDKKVGSAIGVFYTS